MQLQKISYFGSSEFCRVVSASAKGYVNPSAENTMKLQSTVGTLEIHNQSFLYFVLMEKFLYISNRKLI